MSAIFKQKLMIREALFMVFTWDFKRCKGVHCVDLGESFPTRIYLQNRCRYSRKRAPRSLREIIQYYSIVSLATMAVCVCVSRMLVFLWANRSFHWVFGFSRRRRESVCWRRLESVCWRGERRVRRIGTPRISGKLLTKIPQIMPTTNKWMTDFVKVQRIFQPSEK